MMFITILALASIAFAQPVFNSAENPPNAVSFEILPCNGMGRQEIEFALENGVFFYGEVSTTMDPPHVSVLINDDEAMISPFDTLGTRIEDHLSQILGCEFEVTEVEHIFSELLPESDMAVANFMPLHEAFETTRTVGAVAPSSLDLRADINGGVRHQGQFGTCAAFSAATVKAYHEKLDFAFEGVFSPRFIYAHRRNHPSSGMQMSDVYNILQDKGSLEEDKMPYSGMNSDETEDVISAEHLEDALRHVVAERLILMYTSSYHNRVAEFKDEFKRAMHTFGAGIVTTNVWNQGCEMWKRRSQDNKMLGGHAMTVVAYDESGITIQNSWGNKWCKNGYTSVSWEDAVMYTRGYYFYKDVPTPAGWKYQLRGSTGQEHVKIFDGEDEHEEFLSTQWTDFYAFDDSIVINFQNDNGPRDVYFRSDYHADIRHDSNWNGWNCGEAHENERCNLVRLGTFAWKGNYQIDFPRRIPPLAVSLSSTASGNGAINCIDSEDDTICESSSQGATLTLNIPRNAVDMIRLEKVSAHMFNAEVKVDGTLCGRVTQTRGMTDVICQQPIRGSEITITSTAQNKISLADVEIFGPAWTFVDDVLPDYWSCRQSSHAYTNLGAAQSACLVDNYCGAIFYAGSGWTLKSGYYQGGRFYMMRLTTGCAFWPTNGYNGNSFWIRTGHVSPNGKRAQIKSNQRRS